MRCLVNRNPRTGLISEVLAPNGLKSKAYETIFSVLKNKEQSLILYKKLNSDEFLNWFSQYGKIDDNKDPIIFKGDKGLYVQLANDSQDVKYLDSTFDVNLNTELVNKLKTTPIKPNPIKSGYVKEDGTEVTRRITHKVQEYNKRRFQSVQGDAMKPVYADLGTVVHSYMEHLINNIVENKSFDQNTIYNQVKDNLSKIKDKEGNTVYDKYDIDVFNLSKYHYNDLYNLAYDLATDIINKGSNRGGITNILTEQVIYDPKTDTGGTIDLMVIHGDGSVSLYDYKTIFGLFEYENKQWVRTKEMKDYKRTGYSIQVKAQMKILREVYGVDKFNETRMIPIHANVKYDKNKEEQIPVFSFMKTKYVVNDKNEDTAYKPIVVANELSKDPNENKLLAILRERQQNIKTRLGKSYSQMSDREREDLHNELNRLEEAQQYILVDGDPNVIFDEINNVVDYLNNIIQSNNVITKEIERNISDNLELLTYYENISRTALKLNKDKGIEISANISEIRNNLLNYLIEKYSEKYNVDLSIPLLEKGVGDWLVNRSELEGEEFKLFNILLDESLGKTREKVNEIAFWGEDFKKRSDKDLQRIFDKLINPEFKNLHYKYTTDYYKSLDEARESGDDTFIIDNFNVSNEWQSYYDDKRIEKLNSMRSRKLLDSDGKPINKQAEKELEYFERRFDIVNYENARLNRSNQSWLVPKDPDKWLSPEYKLIKSDPLALELYNKWIDTNVIAKKLGIENPLNFLPSIRKRFSENVRDGNPISAVTKEIANDLKAADVGNTQLINVGDDASIPIFFQAPIFTKGDESRLSELENKSRDDNEQEEYNKLKERKERSLSIDDKSTDLLTNIILYHKMMYNYHHMSLAESTYKNLKFIIENKDQYLKDKFGYAKEDPDTHELITGKGNENNKKILETLAKNYFYGDSSQGPDKLFKVFGKDISVKKTLLAAKQALSVKALGLNFLSAAGNGINAYMNSVISGKGGQFYSSKQLRKAFTMLGTDSKKAGALTELFSIFDDSWDYDRAVKVSRLGVSKEFRYDNLFILQKYAEKVVSTPVLLASLSNWGLDSNNNLKRLDRLPEGTKSLLDRVEFKDNKITIDGVTNNREIYDKVRKLIKGIDISIRGGINKEDIHAAGATIYGNMLLHFRNWIVPTARARLKKMQKIPGTDDIFDVGRYRSFGEDLKGILMADMAETKLVTISKIAADVMLGGIYKFNKLGSSNLDDVYDKLYQNYLNKRKHLPKSELASRDQFIEAKQAKFREAIVELRAILGAILLYSLASADWDDDGEKDYKNWWLSKGAVKVLDRAVTELTFYVDPFSFDKFVQKPIPVIGLLNSAYSLIGNTGDEIRDVVFGEDNPRDVRGIFYETSKFVPGLYQGLNIATEIIEDERNLPKVGEREFQFFDRVID